MICYDLILWMSIVKTSKATIFNQRHVHLFSLEEAYWCCCWQFCHSHAPREKWCIEYACISTQTIHPRSEILEKLWWDGVCKWGRTTVMPLKSVRLGVDANFLCVCFQLFYEPSHRRCVVAGSIILLLKDLYHTAHAPSFSKLWKYHVCTMCWWRKLFRQRKWRKARQSW